MPHLLLALLLLSATTAHAEPGPRPLAVVFVTVEAARDADGDGVQTLGEALGWRRKALAAPPAPEVTDDVIAAAEELRREVRGE